MRSIKTTTRSRVTKIPRTKNNNETRAKLTATMLTGLIITTTSQIQADYQSGLEAYQNGDFTTAIAEWKEEIETPLGTADPATRAETLYAIGMLFWLGQGVQQDTIESASWLELAAEMYHHDAQTKLAYLYSTGQGVRQSNFEALKWWQMAANQGNADAQYNLGVLYRDGVGVEPNGNESLKWFREAHSNGDTVSAGVIENYEQTGTLLTIHGTRLAVEPENLKWPSITHLPAQVNQPPDAITLADTAEDTELADSLDDADSMVLEPLVEHQKWPVAVSQESQVIADDITAKIIDSNEMAATPPDVSYEDWIRQRVPEHYTIQVIALSQPEKLHEYIRQHPQMAPFAIYTQTRYEQPLWVLVQGDYPDVESARRAVRSFPQDMQKRDKLWIRLFGMVQGLLE
jgi:hypothetical protein